VLTPVSVASFVIIGSSSALMIRGIVIWICVWFVVVGVVVFIWCDSVAVLRVCVRR